MDEKAFTILELVIVLSVLVILIGIAIPRIKGMQQAGQTAQVKAEL
jgi:prepilin-type N-terminal cleavage/methylation domain-containing protein